MSEPASPLTTPAALDALSLSLAGYDHNTVRRGEAYARARRVRDLWEDGDVLTASVQGSESDAYTTTLRWDGAAWHSECSCPVERGCKHAYALARVWLNRRDLRAAAVARPADTLVLSSSPAPSRKNKHSFRDEWTARLAEQIGRALTPDESRLLGQLSALFNEFRSHQHRLIPRHLSNHGFTVSPEALDGEWGPVFAGWWPREQPPADPWALWQYLAYDAERAGRPIPEAFRPMTDTAAVRAAVESRLVQKELDHWRRTLSAQVRTESYSPPRDFIAPADLRLAIQPDAKARIEVRALAGKPWKAPTQKWLGDLAVAGLDDLAPLPPAAQALALLLRLGASHDLRYHLRAIPEDLLARILAHAPAADAIVLPDGGPFRIEPEPLRHITRPDPADPARLVLALVRPDLSPAPEGLRPLVTGKTPLYLLDDRVWRGPLPLPPRLPVAALSDPGIASVLRTRGVALPDSIEARFKTVVLRPLLRCWLQEPADSPGQTPSLHVRLFAASDAPRCVQHWPGAGGWQWTDDGRPAPSGPDDPHYTYDLSAANAVGATFGAFGLHYSEWSGSWSRIAGKTFPEDFLAWRAALPSGLDIEVSPDLQGLLGAPLRARLAVSAAPAEASGQDWFDLTLQLQPEDLTLTPDEIQLLVKARGQWVRLPKRGWQRLSLDDALSPGERAALDRLGLAADSEVLSGRRTTHRYHALQLAEAPVDDAALAARLRARAADIRALPPPALPGGLVADLRPYQLEGYHFLAHLSAHGLGGVLADDMGLGKTLQTLAWLLHLGRLTPTIANPQSEISNADARDAGFRALIVAPKSVVPNWSAEAARFTPALTTARLAPGLPPPPEARILVINYTQLRLRAAELAAIPWDAVVLDEGQNIKNPASATARAARDLPARHRLVLTGTPIENRLLDLWSLFAFAQPGLLGPQASFQRLYNDKDDPAGARSRLAARTRPFLLRRTKAQVARDLPARIEEEIACELEGPQRALYEAELKRARQLLLQVKDARQFDAQRFNILQSLLRLRQICCDPRLVGLDPTEKAAAPAPKKRGRPAKAASTPDATRGGGGERADSAAPPPDSAKLEALLDTLEPLVAEGHRVLVFSQFVTMLELIRAELVARDIGHLLLTGRTEDRQSLVDRFQAPDGPPVFLLSLKAAGSGLNLTAASYVVLYDPWWNPAVEAQAIDRTHRIGQKNQVMAYRLIAKDTIEEKIRALQREKAELAAAVVQEESLAAVMDLESLRRILG
jgi:hypothetical protein